MALGPEHAVPHSPEDARQLPLSGFEEHVNVRVPGRLRWIAAGKILWDALRHPNVGSTLILDGQANEVRVVHWNNPREQVQEQTRIYKPLT